MKRIIVVLVFFSLLLTSACNLIDTPTNDGEQEESSGYVKSSLARETSPEVDPSQLLTLSEEMTNFSLTFFKEINQNEGNIVFSPFSISLALSMALAGAETSTETAMLEALQFSYPEEEIHPSLNALLLEIEDSQQSTDGEDKDKQFQLNIANSIWGQAGFDFKEIFSTHWR